MAKQDPLYDDADVLIEDRPQEAAVPPGLSLEEAHLAPVIAALPPAAVDGDEPGVEGSMAEQAVVLGDMQLLFTQIMLRQLEAAQAMLNLWAGWMFPPRGPRE